ncbi:MAG: hypothetical protein RXR31_03965, partial [Thermoproteota archaeon]
EELILNLKDGTKLSVRPVIVSVAKVGYDPNGLPMYNIAINTEYTILDSRGGQIKPLQGPEIVGFEADKKDWGWANLKLEDKSELAVRLSIGYIIKVPHPQNPIFPMYQIMLNVTVRQINVPKENLRKRDTGSTFHV